ncbi:hypothetical protein HID58_047211 [Brassica napus]|uniref:Uncharacterized protein n=1 Tax=Brassica napus TaxID=3708 RepID=A0ABQ8AYT1_BRANA|nr:hypothetical protein HID58_047211 [Brassica napus]
MQKFVCQFHWLGFDQSFRLLSIHRNEIASGSIVVNKIRLILIARYLSNNGIGRCPHIKSVKVRYVVPSGALVGIYEDLELRDGGSNYIGKIQDPTQQTDIDNFMVSGVMEPKTSRLIANCILAVWKAGVIDSLSMAFSLQSEGRRAKEPKPMSADSFENYNQEEKERLCNNYFYVALSEK